MHEGINDLSQICVRVDQNESYSLCDYIVARWVFRIVSGLEHFIL